ncbi:DinB family protein [Peribacillus cavernae]|uniref:DinB family protein n=1 Tax=Peribacillus cavernae TaxID=1674310 RepID=A0A3S1BC57_9BACI|nr:DinB family protein [Peribacillus cavernae]MDQ0217918.1 putative damage-inducible protein DinB [Peribacillus cavernae]RUQ32570.1 DinB family protein [Peribacillus cavernae]
MNEIDIIVMNLKETRRRSVKLWESLPDEWITWQPDEEALSFGEMIRHVWGASYHYHMVLLNNGSLKIEEPAPFEQEPISSVKREAELSEPYFNDFIAYVQSLHPEELHLRLVDRSDVGYQRYLGDMLLRIAYHDAVHAGQFLQYIRQAGLERPNIWD